MLMLTKKSVLVIKQMRNVYGYQFKTIKDNEINKKLLGKRENEINEERSTDNIKNPFYNKEAARMKRELDEKCDDVRKWQNNFEMDKGKKPSLDDFKSDAVVSE